MVPALAHRCADRARSAPERRRPGRTDIANNRTWLKAYWDDAHAFWNASKPLENSDTLIAMWFDVCGPSGGLFAKTKCTDFEPFISFAFMNYASSSTSSFASKKIYSAPFFQFCRRSEGSYW